MIDWDCSIPKESAERRLNVKPGSLGLGELAQKLSERFYADEMISIRDPNVTPITNSAVYLAGEMIPGRKPYCVAKGLGVLVKGSRLDLNPRSANFLAKNHDSSVDTIS